jgi:hypothetical protein
MKEETKRAVFGGFMYVTGLVGGAFLVGPISDGVYRMKSVQSGYVAPRNLRIDHPDLDENGEPETRMTVNGIEYLLREIDGKPVLSRFEVEREQKIPPRIRFKD